MTEKITAVSIGNRKLSSAAEAQVALLKQDFLHVQMTSQYVESIAACLQQLMGQFILKRASVVKQCRHKTYLIDSAETKGSAKHTT